MNETYIDWTKSTIPDSQMALSFFINRFAIDYNDQQLSKLIGQVPNEQLLFKYQFKKIKAKAIVCLQKWVSGDWNLILSEKIFTPYEVLSYQAQGIRPVTMKFSAAEAPVLHRKSSLDFFVHDLEHGYMFFYDETLMTMQRDFFSRIETSLSSGLWNKYLTDSVFREKFYYMISDMNSHQEHYRAYLRSILPLGESSNFDFLFV